MRRTLSLVLAVVLAPLLGAGAAARTPARPDERPALRVSGEALSASVEEHEKNYVRLFVKIRFRFFNASDRPLILFDREPSSNMIALSFSAEDAAADRFAYSSYHLPSVYRAPGTQWERVLRDLDSKTPPAGLTRTLPPGGSWVWEKDYWWTMSKQGDSRDLYNGRKDKGWEELRQASPLWLTLYLQMWPTHVEPRRTGISDGVAKLGKKLHRRWRAFGDLWLDGVGSEPIRLEVKDVPAQAQARGPGI